MVRIPVLCPHCHSDQVIKGGKTKAGHQRYKCQNAHCPHYLRIPLCSMSPEILNLLKKGHENASPGTHANPLLASICA